MTVRLAFRSSHLNDGISMDSLWMTFPLLEALPAFQHRFLLRHPAISVDAERTEAVARLWDWHLEQVAEMGFHQDSLCLAEQVHGAEVAVVSEALSSTVSGVDGLLTATPGLLLGIYVADCGPLFLADPVTGACGVVHSGKKGSDLGIAAAAVHRMETEFGADPANIRAQLGPCIRPPAYDVDFSAQIRESCLSAGIRPEHYADCGVCTSSDLKRYYSYRIEKGRTGRLLALLGRAVEKVA